MLKGGLWKCFVASQTSPRTCLVFVLCLECLWCVRSFRGLRNGSRGSDKRGQKKRGKTGCLRRSHGEGVSGTQVAIDRRPDVNPIPCVRSSRRVAVDG